MEGPLPPSSSHTDHCYHNGLSSRLGLAGARAAGTRGLEVLPLTLLWHGPQEAHHHHAQRGSCAAPGWEPGPPGLENPETRAASPAPRPAWGSSRGTQGRAPPASRRKASRPALAWAGEGRAGLWSKLSLSLAAVPARGLPPGPQFPHLYSGQGLNLRPFQYHSLSATGLGKRLSPNGQALGVVLGPSTRGPGPSTARWSPVSSHAVLCRTT